MMSDTPSLEQRFEQLARENEQRKSELEKLGEATKAYRGLTAIKTIWLFGFAALVFFSAVALIPGVQVWIATKLGVAETLFGPIAEGSATLGGNSRDTADPAIFGQFMTLFLAVAAGGIAYMASMMGMRRLENYDQQFAEFRKEHREFTRETQTSLSDRQKELKSELTASIGSEREKTTKDISEQTASKLEEAKNKLEQQLADSSAQILRLQTELDARFGFVADSTTIRDVLADVPSVSEVHKKVTRWCGSDQTAKARDLVKAVLANRMPGREALRATGDSNDWFNLGSQLGQNDEFSLGLKVTLAGLLQERTFSLREGVAG